MKNKTESKAKKWIWRILFLAALGVFIYSGSQLFHIYYQNYKEGKEKDEITVIAKVPKDPEKEAFSIDWDALKERNDKVIGWIMIPDTDISYPVVQGGDNTFYLTHTFAKAENYAGAIFVDAYASPGFADNNTFIYGHNVKHGTMFAEIENFKDPEFYKQHPYVYLFTPDQNYRCEVVSMYSTKDSSKSYTMGTGDEESYGEYISMVKSLAEIKNDIEMSAADKMITLSTCSYEVGGEASDARYLLHAKLTPWEGKYYVEDEKK